MAMNILLVDDEPFALRDIERVVKSVEPEANIKTSDDVAEALEICRDFAVDVAFLDIQMPGMNGISLAEEIMKIYPKANIIMVTAYRQYTYDALKIFVSGYMLKPADEKEVRRALENLRHPVDKAERKLFVKCFGNCEVFFEGRPISFERKRTKELFAYLVDRHGASVTMAEVCAAMWEDRADEKAMDYCRHLWRDLKNTFEKLGLGDVLYKARNAYAVVPEMMDCDYYEAMREGALRDFRGEYMAQYSWAEYSRGHLFSEADI